MLSHCLGDVLILEGSLASSRKRLILKCRPLLSDSYSPSLSQLKWLLLFLSTTTQGASFPSCELDLPLPIVVSGTLSQRQVPSPVSLLPFP